MSLLTRRQTRRERRGLDERPETTVTIEGASDGRLNGRSPAGFPDGPNSGGRRTRLLALYLIGLIVIAATGTAFVQSYDGLYQWARRYLDEGWARTWPLQVDAWIAVGELALYVAYRDGWATRRKIWPWTAAGTGLVVSTAFNVGHMSGVDLAGHVTAAVPPIAAFAGLALGLQVLKYVEQPEDRATPTPAETEAGRTENTDGSTVTERHRGVGPGQRGRGNLIAETRTLLAREPNITGQQLGDRLQVSERTGRRLLRRVSDSGGAQNR